MHNAFCLCISLYFLNVVYIFEVLFRNVFIIQIPISFNKNKLPVMALPLYELYYCMLFYVFYGLKRFLQEHFIHEINERK